MGKFSGKVGIITTVETAQSVWEAVAIEKSYVGEVTRNSRRYQTGENLNDDVVLNNEISILADESALMNFHNMKYVVWMGAKWKITNIEVRRPRLILTIGGLYNGG